MYVTKTIVGRDWRVVEISKDAATTIHVFFLYIQIVCAYCAILLSLVKPLIKINQRLSLIYTTALSFCQCRNRYSGYFYVKIDPNATKPLPIPLPILHVSTGLARAACTQSFIIKLPRAQTRSLLCTANKFKF